VAAMFHIEAMSDSLLYTKFVVALLVPLHIIVQLFNDVLLFTLMIITMMSFVTIIVIANLL
jgi:hypothetical protein